MNRRKTRNQRKRETIEGVLCLLATVPLWVIVGFLMFKAWESEPTISEAEHRAYIETLNGSGYVATPKASDEPAPEPVQKEQEEEPKPAPPFDVPLDAELQLYIIEQAESHGIDPAVVVAMIWRESRYRADAIGDNGQSFGLMQVQPRWHYDRMERLGCPDLLDPYQNVTVGVDYLAEQLRRYDGDLAAAVTAYNRGHYAGEITGYAADVLAKAAELAVVE